MMAVLAAVALLTPIGPANAEISAGPTTDWGVEGLATGTANDSIRSSVFAIEQVGNRIFVGGRFTDVTEDGVGSTPRPYLAAFDATTGDWISSFTPTLNGSVLALQAAPDGSRLFVGGDFDTVNGQTAEALVALDPTTGAIDPTWAGTLTSASAVRGFDIQDNWLYVVGGFNGVVSPAGNNLAMRAARFDWQTSAHDPNWRPMVQGGSPWGVAASADADRVYLAGYFLTVDGAAVTGGFAAVTASTGTYVTPSEPFPVNTANVSRQYLYDVEVVNGNVFAGGSEHFVAVLAESDLSLQRFHRSRAKGDYQDLEVVGNRVYAGCHCRADAIIESSDDVLWFNTVPSGETNGVVDTVTPTTWVAAYDATTGNVISSFEPDITATRAGVWAIHGSSDGCLWLGGDLTGANGRRVDSMVRLCDPASIDDVRPSTPGRPQVGAVGADSVDLTWNPSTDNVGVTEYRIYDNTTGQVVATSPVPSTTVAGLAPTVLQLYTRAFDAAGNQSWRSGITTVEITGEADDQRPSTPTGLVLLDVNGTSADLSWNPSTDNVGVAGYHVYDSATSQIIASTTATTVTLTGLPAGATTVYVKAFDAAGNTSWRSNLRTVTIG